jgi:hypothetical protein
LKGIEDFDLETPAPRENFKAKAWGRICRRQSLLDKLPINMCLSSLYIEETTIEG